jgi:RNA polymerase sigma-70 factor (ECF subfamily)
VNRNSSPFWELVEVEHKKASAYCVRLAGNPDDGGDLYQDSIISAYRGFRELRNEASFRPWLYRIINNLYKARFRNPWWRIVFLAGEQVDETSKSDDPTAVYNARRRLEIAFKAIGADDRIIVVLAELEGWKISEIAELLAKSEGFVKMRLSRARLKMRRKLAAMYRSSSSKARDGGNEELCYVNKPDND